MNLLKIAKALFKSKFYSPEQVRGWYEHTGHKFENDNKRFKAELNKYLIENLPSSKRESIKPGHSPSDDYLKDVMNAVIGWTNSPENVTMRVKEPESYKKKLDLFLKEFGIPRSFYIQQLTSKSTPLREEVLSAMNIMDTGLTRSPGSKRLEEQHRMVDKIKSKSNQYDTPSYRETPRFEPEKPKSGGGFWEKVKGMFKKSSSNQSNFMIIGMVRLGFTEEEIYDLCVVNEIDVDIIPIY